MFVYNETCVTAAECVALANDPKSDYEYYHAYAATRECVGSSVKNEDGFDKE